MYDHAIQFHVGLLLRNQCVDSQTLWTHVRVAVVMEQTTVLLVSVTRPVSASEIVVLTTLKNAKVTRLIL